MSGFRKAKAEQAAIKMGLYGPAGSGKTFTSLLIAEGLAKATGGRIAFVDTERGTDFYCKEVPERTVHPAAFDFDALYTKSMTEILTECKKLKHPEYSVVVLDSITHVWESARLAYSGKTTRAGTIPMHAWGSIKKPYKELMSLLLSSPMHVLFCGRQGNEYAEDEDGELKMVGVKMKAEGETPYEPHILIRMESVKGNRPSDPAKIFAYAEKDRTGILTGKVFTNPTFDQLCKPILGLLGDKQAAVQDSDDVAALDAETLEDQRRQKEAESADLLRHWTAKIDLASTAADVKAVGKEITPELKKRMLTEHVNQLRDKYQDRERAVQIGA